MGALSHEDYAVPERINKSVRETEVDINENNQKEEDTVEEKEHYTCIKQIGHSINSLITRPFATNDLQVNPLFSDNGISKSYGSNDILEHDLSRKNGKHVLSMITKNGVVIDVDKEYFGKSIDYHSDYLESKDYMSSADFGEKSVNCCENKTMMIKTILAGQGLSLLLCGTGTAATTLSSKFNVSIPCFNAFFMYTVLASTFGIYVMVKFDVKKIMKKHWWKYFIVALLDVEGNYLLTKSYSYATLTSVQLCDSFTIPTVMFISFIFLRIRYKLIHYAGVVICIAGAVSLVFLDSGDKSHNAPNEVLGDIMALSAAVLYGISQIGQEYLVKKYSATQYLGIAGIYGFFISGIQTSIVERNTIPKIQWKWQIVLIILAFVLCQYLYYALMPLVMKLSSATVVNLSLLTSDLYTLIVGLGLFQYKFSYWYFLAFSGILIGLVTYNIKSTPTAPKKAKKKKRFKKKEGVINQTKEPTTVSKFLKMNSIKFNGHLPLLSSKKNTEEYTRL